MEDARDPLDVAATAARLRGLHRREVFDEPTLARLLAEAAAGPDAFGWRLLLDRLSLALGAGLVVASVIYFFAGNWAAMPPFAKLGGLAALVAGGAGWALYAPDRPSGRIALTCAAGFAGSLLAVYGQIYQTGADAWILFAAWAALIVPWVAAARFEPLTLLWLAVAAVGLHLALDQHALPEVLERQPPGLLLALVPGLAWVVSEALPPARRPARWFVRVVGVATFASVTVVGILLVVDGDDLGSGVGALLGVLVGVVAGGWSLGVARRRPIDLVLATAALGAAATVVSVLLGRLFFDTLRLEEAGLLLLALAIIGQVGGAAVWLRHLWREGAQ